MKKLSLTLAALALVLGMSQCNKEKSPVLNGETQHIVLTATNGNDGSKVSGAFASAAALNLTWDGDESITVSGGAEGTLTFKSGEGTADATFEGNITKGSGDIVFTIGSAPSSSDFANQIGTADGCAAWIKGHNHFVGTSQWQDDGNYNVTMELQYAVLKLDVSALGTTGAMTIAANGATVASVADVTSSVGKAVFVAVPTNGSTTAYTITCGGKTATKPWKLEKNVFYTKAGAEGAGTGEAIVIDTPKFSVSATTTVEFAPGNLYWDGSSWQFEANQWDFRTYAGKNSCIGGSVKTDGTPAGHWGLFGWSGSTGSATYGMSTSQDNSDYSGDFKDWGGLAIGDYAANTWHTLSNDEWDYLLNDRTDAESLRAWVTLTDVNVSGLVILPDESDETANGVTTTVLVAASGAVFFPAAGGRYGTEVSSVGSDGIYWSSTPDEDYEVGAYYVDFYLDNVETIYDGRNRGHAVRLVR